MTTMMGRLLARLDDRTGGRLPGADDRWAAADLAGAAEVTEWDRRRQVRDSCDRLARGVIVMVVGNDLVELVSLRGACLAGLVPRCPANAKMDHWRYGEAFPRPVRREGCTDYFEPGELADWYSRNPQLRDRPAVTYRDLAAEQDRDDEIAVVG
jgi:hypothetical protein